MMISVRFRSWPEQALLSGAGALDCNRDLNASETGLALLPYFHMADEGTHQPNASRMFGGR